MADIENLPVAWTERAHSDSITIKSYLAYHFTQREIENYYKLLGSFEKIVAIFPDLYPLTNKAKNIHRAVLSKQLSVFYQITQEAVFIVAILDNRMSNTKWP